MTKHDSDVADELVITRIFDAPREMVWKAWTDPKCVMQWLGPKGFTSPACKADFRVGGKFLFCMRAPDGKDYWSGGEYFEIVPHEKIVYTMYFADPEGNRVEPATYGVSHDSIIEEFDVVSFEDFGNGQTKFTIHGNESIESAKSSGQYEGWMQSLDKMAAVVAELAHG
jgi:uncharacterized protein YndB with AHSA1/START domain